MRFPALLGLLLFPLARGDAQEAAPNAVCSPARTALVLSGGGAKGLAHVGVLEVLDSLGIVPDLVVGTSMGAIVGALYASGDTPAEVRARLDAAQFDRLIRRYEPQVSASLGALKPALVWEREPAHWVLQMGAAREAEVSAAMSKLLLRANLSALGDFDSLPIPFRAVATDLDSRQVVPLARGDLARAERASMAIPLLLRPVEIDGHSLVDGGLSSNVPVGVARALGAQRLIVSVVASPRPDPAAFDDPLTVTTQLFEYLFVQDSIDPGAFDVVIQQPTEAYGMMDFRAVTVDSLVALGHRTAARAFAGAACVRTERSGRPAARTLAIRAGRVSIDTAVRGRDVIQRELHLRTNGVLDPTFLAQGLTWLASQERYRGVWLEPSGEAARPDFALRVDDAPSRAFGLGVAFDHTMSGRLWIAAVDRQLGARDLEGSALLGVGTWRRDLALTARRRARIGAWSVPVGGSLQLLSEEVRLWDGDTELPAVRVEEASLSVGMQPLYQPGWSNALGIEHRVWRDGGIRRRGTVGAHYALRFREAGSPVPIVSIEATALQAWQRVAVDLAATEEVGRLEVRPRLRAGWGRDLPVHQTFTLGGQEGFAGVQMLEQRGDRELYASLLLRWPIVRQLHARLEPMAGVTGVGDFLDGPGPLDGTILVGVRAGIDLETPIGPIRIEEGFNNQGRRQALVRVGLWF